MTTANISVIFSTITYTSDVLLGPSAASFPFAKVTLEVVDGLGNLAIYTKTSDPMQGGAASIDENGKYVYEFAGSSFGIIPVHTSHVGFLQSDGTGSKSYSVSFALLNSSFNPVNSGFTVDGAGSVNVSYVYTPVPEPATGALALAGVGLLFGWRRRRVA